MVPANPKTNQIYMNSSTVYFGGYGIIRTYSSEWFASGQG